MNKDFIQKYPKTQLSNQNISELIDYYGKYADFKHNTSISGIGEDTAAIEENGKYRLLSNVLLFEGINFDLTYTPFKHLGYKAIVAAISDIFAMNGYPEQISIVLGLSQKIMTEMVDEFMKGVMSACTVYNIDMIDFRLVPSFTGLTISVMITGVVEKSMKVSRKNGRTSDLICVSGDLGSAYMGLQLLQREKRVLKGNDIAQPDFGINNDYVLERQLKPEAKKYVIDFLKDIKLVPTSMVNVKNGLASALWDICRASKTGCRIFEKKIPFHQTTLKVSHELNYNPLIAALNGGEDYELLFTLPISEHEKINKQFPENINMIGYLTEPDLSCRMITGNDEEIEIREI